jgi:hypothetical protein
MGALNSGAIEAIAAPRQLQVLQYTWQPSFAFARKGVWALLSVNIYVDK